MEPNKAPANAGDENKAIAEQAKKELEAEGYEMEGSPKKEEPAQDKAPEDPKKPEEKPKEDPAKDQPKADEQPKKKNYVPSWKVAALARQLEEAKAELEKVKASQAPKDEGEEEDPDIDEEEIETPPARKSKKDTDETTKRLARLEKLEADRIEQQAYEDEFSDLEPTIRKEYPSISSAQLLEIKGKLKKLAFSEEYIYSPLSLVYSGLQDFRGLATVKEGRKTGEATKGMGSRDQVVDFDNLSEEDFDKLSPDQVEAYTKYQRQKRGQ